MKKPDDFFPNPEVIEINIYNNKDDDDIRCGCESCNRPEDWCDNDPEILGLDL